MMMRLAGPTRSCKNQRKNNFERIHGRICFLNKFYRDPYKKIVLPIFGPTTARDSIGMFADTFIDPFAHITIREKELFGASGSNLDYYSIKATTTVDFRADNVTNFDSLEKNSLDLYSSFKSIYLQDRENKIKNSTTSEDEWGNLDN